VSHPAAERHLFPLPVSLTLRRISRAAATTVGGLAGLAGAISYNHLRQLAIADGCSVPIWTV